MSCKAPNPPPKPELPPNESAREETIRVQAASVWRLLAYRLLIVPCHILDCAKYFLSLPMPPHRAEDFAPYDFTRDLAPRLKVWTARRLPSWPPPYDNPPPGSEYGPPDPGPGPSKGVRWLRPKGPA